MGTCRGRGCAWGAKGFIGHGEDAWNRQWARGAEVLGPQPRRTLAVTRRCRAPAPLPACARGASRGRSSAACVASGCYPNPGYGRRRGRPAPARLLRGPRRRGQSVAASRRSSRGSRRPPGKPGARRERRAGPDTELVGAGAKQVRRGHARVRVGVPRPGLRAPARGLSRSQVPISRSAGFSRTFPFPAHTQIARLSPVLRGDPRGPLLTFGAGSGLRNAKPQSYFAEAPTPGGKRRPGIPNLAYREPLVP